VSRDVCSYSRPCRPSQLQSHLSEMATASKRKRSSYDAAFKLRVIESAHNSNNYANLLVYHGLLFVFRTLKCRKTKCTILPVILPTTYTRVNDFGQHMDPISGGATYMWERLIGEYIWYCEYYKKSMQN